jgi:hypothetical protein
MRIVWIVCAAAICGGAWLGCRQVRRGDHVPPDIEARLPTGLGELWYLCPAPDIPQRLYDEQARRARDSARALIREVRRRPHDLVTFTSYGAHTGETYRRELTIRALAKEHLRNPGIEGVPCQRALMQELQDAVRGHSGPTAPGPGVRNERVYTHDEVIEALDLEKRGAMYTTRTGCRIGSIHTNEWEVRLARREHIAEAIIAAPDGTVGVGAFKPSAGCRQDIERRLATLAASK